MNNYSVSKLPTDVLQETAQKHRALRKQMQLSQADLAERSGVSLGSLKRFEQTGKISFEHLLKLAHVLGRLPEFEQLFLPIENLDRIESLFSDKMKNQ
ncbi:MAG: helix-turn-helix transcriptional regulator [Bacteroidota bacterium]